jgi:ABC-type phosphate/phosphonate transport system substrate-binding protein
MRILYQSIAFTTSATALLFATVASLSAEEKTPASSAATAEPLTMVVMDPLAKELSCPCVKGYAQRDYAKLAEFLGSRLGRPVTIAFSESLVTAVEKDTGGKADLVIGKQSVVRRDAGRLKRSLRRTALLAGKDGLHTQTGLIVVPDVDPAKSVADLKDYLLVFGPAECDEKFSAATALLKQHGIAIPAKPETAAGCEEGALRILDLPAGKHGAAVISSYAKPLLEGCGTVPKGALRIVGETTPVPFIAAFVSGDLPKELQAQIAAALASTAAEPLLCFALESKRGFALVEDDAATDTNSTAAKSNYPTPDVKKK